jgi:hypothetical protein
MSPASHLWGLNRRVHARIRTAALAKDAGDGADGARIALARRQGGGAGGERARAARAEQAGRVRRLTRVAAVGTDRAVCRVPKVPQSGRQQRGGKDTQRARLSAYSRTWSHPS